MSSHMSPATSYIFNHSSKLNTEYSLVGQSRVDCSYLYILERYHCVNTVPNSWASKKFYSTRNCNKISPVGSKLNLEISKCLNVYMYVRAL